VQLTEQTDITCRTTIYSEETHATAVYYHLQPGTPERR